MAVDWDAAALVGLLAKVADISFVLDRDGGITELASDGGELAAHIDHHWLGRSLLDTVAGDSRQRLAGVLAAALANPAVAQRIDLVHTLEDGASLPVEYRLAALPDGGGVIAVGRDMRPVASLRQQLLNAQQALEQDYWRLRQVETRYRQLFDMIADAILVVDAGSGRTLEANPAAGELLGGGGQRVVGKPFPLGLSERSQRDVAGLLGEAQATGRALLSGVTRAVDDAPLSAVVSYLRQGTETRFLVRLARESADGAGGDEQSLPSSLQRAPDAVLLTDTDGRVLAANKTFLDLAQVLSDDRVIGLSADRWLGRSGVDLSVLLSNLNERGSVKLFSTVLRGDGGVNTDVEISACTLEDAPRGRLAFYIRDVSRRVSDGQASGENLPASIEQITRRVGRLPLKELVRESTDIIEAMCIRAALELTQDNRASAAELLGLSRQSLYAKLRRYDISGVETDAISS
ncbi:transcriptional regulator PpsR [Pseudohaliea rubra]|uniref:Regulator of carotenoid biosynthesis, Transcriptional regulator, PpsR n=1 Tax=Pseudohaliea rubra DSM 19751 TaxID=1265313 RepID=A0A095VW02_9GAMM|nr:transcriptional regulator PpsR [Pseudohaliea rubra]KGE05223.1 Regulator of carotenoid biosynthesis, Transcriptional regulator, PpsR [Pseudohaliea rubra DSM 19751]